MNEFSRCENAVETPIGMILLLVIMTTVIAGIYAIGVPLIGDAQHNVRIQSMQNDFKILQADVNELKGPLPGEGPSRITTLNIGGGSITVMPDAPTTKIQVSFKNETGTHDVFAGALDVGNIKYTLRGDAIIHENGAVITKYAASEIMISRPNMFITPVGDNITVMLHMINSHGNLSSVGGGTASVHSRFVEFDNSSDFKNKPVATIPSKTVNITITSEYYKAWERFFNESAREAGIDITNVTQYKISYPVSNMVNVTINGKGGSAVADIFLSVHETIIRSSVS